MKQDIIQVLKSHQCEHADIEQPRNLKFGDIAITLARDAKNLKLKPAELAGKVQESLEKVFPEASFTAMGPFLNIKFPAKDFAKLVIDEVLDDQYLQSTTVQKKVMVEFSQPNTHKEFHIGHLRNAAIGDALVRTLRAGGYPVVAANYLGDVGTHIAKCLWAYDQAGRPTPPPPEENVSKFFGGFYSQAYQAYEDQDDVKAAVSDILHAIEKRQEPWSSLWKETRDLCLKNFDNIYEYLNVQFDEVFYESDCDEPGQKIVDEFLEKGVFEKSEGAIICNLEEDKLGACLVRKTDGTTLYATKDLALARIKFENFDIEESIYVVGSEQIRHFKQVFKTLEKMGFEQARDCHHIWYDHVVTPTGKMSSRAGRAIGLEYVQNKVEEQVIKEFEKRNIEHDADTSRKLVNAALKYGMLKQDYAKKIMFDLDEWLKFEGDTGMYVLYTFARMRSILRKVGQVHTTDCYELENEAEREFLHTLFAYQKSFKHAVKTKQVNILADQLFKMSKSFNRFYLMSPINKEENKTIQASRVHLLQAFEKVMRHCFHCLNIEPLEKM